VFLRCVFAWCFCVVSDFTIRMNSRTGRCMPWQASCTVWRPSAPRAVFVQEGLGLIRVVNPCLAGANLHSRRTRLQFSFHGGPPLTSEAVKKRLRIPRWPGLDDPGKGPGPILVEFGRSWGSARLEFASCCGPLFCPYKHSQLAVGNEACCWLARFDTATLLVATGGTLSAACRQTAFSTEAL